MANADDFNLLRDEMAAAEALMQITLDAFVSSVEHFNRVEPYAVKPLAEIKNGKVRVDVLLNFREE
jgi:hypothetical protein